MDFLIYFLPLLLFGLLMVFLFGKAKSNQKATTDATDKVTESNDRLAEAVNRLANVIAKK